MTNALVLFRQEYAREIARALGSTLDWLDLRAVVGTVKEAGVVLETGDIEVLLIGERFIESTCAFFTARPDIRRPLVVVIDRTDEASIKARAARHGVDRVVSVARGMSAMFDDLHDCVARPAECCSASKFDGLPGETPSPTILVSDETDCEIVRLVAAGFADREIAETVFLSHQTVRNRVSRILGETGARNRTHLASMYLMLVHEGLTPFAAA